MSLVSILLALMEPTRTVHRYKTASLYYSVGFFPLTDPGLDTLQTLTDKGQV
jgi:hypothetical protein